MLLRRVGGRVRWLPGDLTALPVLLTGLWLLVGLDVVTNRVADGPFTVRVLLASPLDWFTAWTGWLGLGLVAAGVTLGILARRLGQTYRRLVAVRFLPYRVAFLLLAAATALSLWSLSNHITDVSSGGAQWRFVAEARTRWINDVTTILLGLGAVAMLALSFGRVRLVDHEVDDEVTVVPPPAPRQAQRERVPTTTAPSASTSSTMPRGVATKRRSAGTLSRPDSGS